jgi:hypothetical protein
LSETISTIGAVAIMALSKVIEEDRTNLILAQAAVAPQSQRSVFGPVVSRFTFLRHRWSVGLTDCWG